MEKGTSLKAALSVRTLVGASAVLVLLGIYGLRGAERAPGGGCDLTSQQRRAVASAIQCAKKEIQFNGDDDPRRKAVAFLCTALLGPLLPLFGREMPIRGEYRKNMGGAMTTGSDAGFVNPQTGELVKFWLRDTHSNRICIQEELWKGEDKDLFMYKTPDIAKVVLASALVHEAEHAAHDHYAIRYPAPVFPGGPRGGGSFGSTKEECAFYESEVKRADGEKETLWDMVSEPLPNTDPSAKNLTLRDKEFRDRLRRIDVFKDKYTKAINNKVN